MPISSELAVHAAQWWNDQQWHYVSSSNVEAFRYDSVTRQLDIMFKGSRVYRYFSIPEVMAEDLANAASPGGWFHANLKGAPFERMS